MLATFLRSAGIFMTFLAPSIPQPAYKFKADHAFLFQLKIEDNVVFMGKYTRK